MARVQGGDADAFRDLYDLTVAGTYARAMRTTRSAEHAAEVVQEVYLHAWKHALDYDPERASLRTWLIVLTHRRAVDRVRSVSSAVARDQREFHRTAAVVPDVAELGIARSEAGRLLVELRQLSDKQRHAIVLTYLRGYTLREAAELLGVPIGTVKTRVHTGVAVLRTRLEAEAA